MSFNEVENRNPFKINPLKIKEGQLFNIRAVRRREVVY